MVRSAFNLLGQYALALGLATLLALSLGGCGEEKKEDETASTTPTPTPVAVDAPQVSMEFPDSLTGGTATASVSSLANALIRPLPHAEEEFNCEFEGAGAGDPFRNGYTMARYLVSSVATWQCFSDFLISLVTQAAAAGGIPTNGTLIPITDDPGGPTGVSVLFEASGQKTLKLYYGGDTTQPGIFLSWMTQAAGTQGRLVLRVAEFLDPAEDLSVDSAGPTHLRMDLQYGAATQSAQMYLAFNPYDDLALWQNDWADGFRIDATKTLSDGSFQLRGFMGMKRQWNPDYSDLYPEDKPSLPMKAVTTASDSGAAVAGMADLGLMFDIGSGDSLGDFLFDKTDTYYFSADRQPEYIDKTISAATYKGGQDLAVSGFTPANIDTFLGTGSAYQTCTASVTGTNAPECATFLNAIFADGEFGAELNMGTLPTDGRAAALDALTMPTQAQPDDNEAGDWTGVFAMNFTPTAP